MQDFTFWRSVSSQVAVCKSSVDWHTGIFTNVLMACTFVFMPVSSSSLFSVQLFQDNQSAMCKSEQGLYIMQTNPRLMNAQHVAL